ncbi:MAG: isoprenylcysteine carboxylmethyltransferase family protein [Lyngbya sp. HA4199-MV5]|jgi:protein-S-isoprenylcysteine O-methyltransferase Ste14|nr:isoprenylcysteine carboxylmethyltransferase family protein [Lyngbya sp. HA4199-MV5]
MNFLTDWGFSTHSWKGERGEYWVLAQVAIVLGFVALPAYRPPSLNLSAPVLYGLWFVAAALGLLALVLLAKGLVDLGHSLTPLPYPREDGQLVRSGVYGFVRHPLYGGLIVAAFSWALYKVSLSHLIGTILVFVFFNAKASREERWLLQKYPDYADYQQQVKRLIPWLY